MGFNSGFKGLIQLLV